MFWVYMWHTAYRLLNTGGTYKAQPARENLARYNCFIKRTPAGCKSGLQITLTSRKASSWLVLWSFISIK